MVHAKFSVGLNGRIDTATLMRMSCLFICLTDGPAPLSSGLRTMPAADVPRPKRVATPSASGCKARSLTLARRPDFSCLSHRVVRTGPAHWNDPRARHARANHWQQITKQLSPQLNTIVQTDPWPVRQRKPQQFSIFGPSQVVARKMKLSGCSSIDHGCGKRRTGEVSRPLKLCEVVHTRVRTLVRSWPKRGWEFADSLYRGVSCEMV